ncbi:MAG: hypothetical protein ACPG21_11100 [Crocinitomicaceae bacterium]
MKAISLNTFKRFDPAHEMHFNTIVGVEEISHHDMIYIYHHIKIGTVVQLEPFGENVKGEKRYEVMFRGFVLGYITISGPLGIFYDDISSCKATVCHFQKKKFLPISEIDLSIQATKTRMVS